MNRNEDTHDVYATIDKQTVLVQLQAKGMFSEGWSDLISLSVIMHIVG